MIFHRDRILTPTYDILVISCDCPFRISDGEIILIIHFGEDLIVLFHMKIVIKMQFNGLHKLIQIHVQEHQHTCGCRKNFIAQTLNSCQIILAKYLLY